MTSTSTPNARFQRSAADDIDVSPIVARRSGWGRLVPRRRERFTVVRPVAGARG